MNSLVPTERSDEHRPSLGKPGVSVDGDDSTKNHQRDNQKPVKILCRCKSHRELFSHSPFPSYGNRRNRVQPRANSSNNANKAGNNANWKTSVWRVNLPGSINRVFSIWSKIS